MQLKQQMVCPSLIAKKQVFLKPQLTLVDSVVESRIIDALQLQTSKAQITNNC